MNFHEVENCHEVECTGDIQWSAGNMKVITSMIEVEPILVRHYILNPIFISS